MNRENKKSTIASVVFHLILLIGLIGVKSSHIMVPSRANGIEVSLISNNEVAPQAKNIANTQETPQIKTLDKPAEVNLHETPKPKPIAPSKLIQPIISKNTNLQTLQQKPQKNKIKQNNQINDLLNQIEPDIKSTGKTKARATGGNNGTADTQNMVSNYADLVINRVRPFVIIPAEIDPNATAIVQVTLLPNMEIDTIKLIKSSGNSEYDNNVQDALNRVRVFPPLPAGAKFTDYRKLRLTFKPQ